MEDQFANLKSLGFELASNVRVPVAAELMPREVEELEERWGVMREAILGTLGRMKREMEEWVEGKVTSMKKLIGEEDEMLSRMMVFVEKFPFESLLQVNLTDLSGEVEELVKYEVGGVGREWWHQVWGGNGGIRCGEGMVASGVGREWWHQVWRGNGGIRCGEGMVASGVGREWWHQVWDILTKLLQHITCLLTSGKWTVYIYVVSDTGLGIARLQSECHHSLPTSDPSMAEASAFGGASDTSVVQSHH